MSEPGSNLAPKRKCVACGYDLEATPCPICQSTQLMKLCDICKKAMPQEADRCNACSSYQGKRKHLPFLAAMALFVSSVFGLVSGGSSGVSYLIDQDSHTKFKVTSSDDKRLYLKVWNTGRKPSTLIGFRLIFDQMPNKEAMLELSDVDQPDATNVIAPGPPVKIGLSIPLESTIPASQRGKQYSDKERHDLLVASPRTERPLTLEVDVEESDDPCCFWNLIPLRTHHARSDKFPAARISKFIVNSMGG